MNNFLDYVLKFAPEITVLGALTIIQITPIKINPWSWLIKMIRKILGTDRLRNNFDHLEKRIDNIEIKFDQQIANLMKDNMARDAKEIRGKIIDFYSNLRNGITYPEDKFEQIFDLEKEYKELIKNTGIENSYLNNAMEYIRKKHLKGGVKDEEIYNA